MAVDELSKNNPDGTRLGQSVTDQISFYGVAVTAQPASASQAAAGAAVATTGAVQDTTTQVNYGYTTSTQANNIVTRVNELIVLTNQLRSELVTLGLIKGSA
ncbi:MAG: hypothetical protein ACE5JS_20775 [Nitrospinota bacterium]